MSDPKFWKRLTPDEVNALPPKVREYVYHLETNADPAGMVFENTMLRDRVKELEAFIQTIMQPPTSGRIDCSKPNLSAGPKDVKMVEWRTIRGTRYRGVLVDTDSNVGIIRCTDGKLRAVEDYETALRVVGGSETSNPDE